MLSRIASLPAPAALRTAPSANKTTDLPSGISGPVVRARKGSKARSCNFSVLLPRFGQAPSCRTVYIGSENTYTIKKCRLALSKAIALRQAAQEAYELAALKARRKAALAMKAALRKSASAR